MCRFSSTPWSPRWRPATTPSMSTAPLARGGYSRALLGAANCRVLAIDRDPEAVRRGRELAPARCGRLSVIEGNFGEMERLLDRAAPGPVAGLALDLGVSSMQLDTPERGFSFRFDGPLDMRMSGTGQSAADLVATLPEDELARLIRDFGEERFARRIARAIAAAQRHRPIRRTLELAADRSRRGAQDRARARSGDPHLSGAAHRRQRRARRARQRSRRGRTAADARRPACGRVVSLARGRRVKDFLRQRSGTAPRASRHEPVRPEIAAPSFRLLHRRPVGPAPEEVARNPRARAARLRAAERTAAPPWPPGRDRQRGQAA